MIKCYLSLAIIFVIQQQVFSHSTNVQQKISALRNKLKKEIQEYQLRSKADDPQDLIENYDLIMSEPALSVVISTTDIPVLRVGQHHRHRSRKHRLRKIDNQPVLRSGADPKETTTVNDPEKLAQEHSSPTSTIASHPKNDTFEANVKLLEAKVEEAIKNLTEYINQTATKSADEAPETGNSRKGNFNLTEYISQIDTKRAEDLVAMETYNPRKGNLYFTNHVSQTDIEQVATTTGNPRKMNSKVSPAIPFYRRFNYLNDKERTKPQKWVHCLDLISPRLQGMNDEGPKNLSSVRRDVKRLAQLLHTNVSKFNAQDMVSMLTQISKLRIRMYQWDPHAISLILDVIIKGREHSFRTLKSGIKVLFNNWHLDTSMLSVFLEQMRIFRPPCIEVSDHAGFTKKPGGIALYTKPHKPKKWHDPDKSCHSREIKYNNDP